MNRQPRLVALLSKASGLPIPDFRSAALVVSRIPYGRPSAPSPAAVLEEWRGTCSTKHLLLHDLIVEEWPDLLPQLWHRVYKVTPELARSRWGDAVAERVPVAGLIDVHTYATITADSSQRVVDVTFPVDAWDGVSDLPLACGPGDDYRAGSAPLATKRELVSLHCDPALREPFIAALSDGASSSAP